LKKGLTIMTTSFNINKADLEFILKQIKIAENTSSAYTAAPVSIKQAIMDAYGFSDADATIAPYGLRTVDGTYNNLLTEANSTLGAADTLFPRLTDPQYVNDSYATPGANVTDAAPRVISNLIVDMTAANPAAVLAALASSVLKGAIVDLDPAVNPGTDNEVANAALAIRDAYNLTKTTDNALAAAKTIQETAAFAAVAEAKALIAKTKADDLVIALAINGAVDPSDITAVDGAIAAALAASNAAKTVVTRLSFAGGVNVTATDIADAQLVADNALLLHTNLGLLKTALIADLNVDPIDNDAAVAAALLAANNLTGAVAETSALNTALPGTQPFITTAEGVATAADTALATLLTSYGIEVNALGSLVMPNRSPDIGLSPSFNSWMTIFGQFFDHGLDLVTKGGSGTVFVPLMADDPLIAGADGVFGTADDLAASLRFMALTRATPTLVDPDGAGPLLPVAQHENTTTAFIDQNQTYTSHASHQVFLREYKTMGGKTVSTGRLLDGTAAGGSVAGAIGNWGEVKAQALQYLGIKLTDFDISSVPLLRTDAYGKFIPDPITGYAQVIISAGADGQLNTADDVVVSGTPANPVDLSTVAVQRTHHAFLNDIAHHAAPSFIDFDHNGIMDGADYRQVADANFDRNGDGLYNFADLDVDGDLTVTNAEIASLVADVNHDGVVNLADVDRNNDGLLTDVDFDIDGNGIVNKADLVADDRNNNTYDNEMLDAHFITGDGRGNENIGLTAVHSVFHSEHNRAVEADKVTILQSGDLAFINEWLVTDLTATDLPLIPTDPTALTAYIATLNWDGDRLFQAGRFTTEMQYQHLVFEEFARRMQPQVNPFVFNNSPNINPSIMAEFAHTVYRFGHSMLTGTVDRLDNNLALVNGETSQQTLLAMFLNPQAYIGSGATIETINANLIRGLSRDVGNAIDEFIVTDVRSNLLGLPLDLGALNIARGRDTGIPSLNNTRAQLYNDTGLADLRPYDSWADFALHIKNAASLVNFIAAYGTHSTITSAITMADKRAAAELLMFGGAGEPLDRLDFLNATGAWIPDGAGTNDDTRGGLNLVDLWIGGLAEANPEFGGMLGSTFNYVFEAQMENLQNGDRMYYLTRTQGTNLLNQLEPNTFSDLVMRNTMLGDKYATHLNAALFVTPDRFIELDRGIAQTDYNGALALGNDPLGVTRRYTASTSTVVDGNHDVGGYLRVVGGEHYVLGGTEGNDTLYGDRGIDALWGDGGNDYLNAGTESDNVFGGDGDDIIEDPFGDDILRGNLGNDVISSARGADILFGDQGNDFILLGQDASEVFGGTGDDFILGGVGSDGLLGNEGNDWIEGGAGFDGITGDNSELFFNSPIIGHDVLFGHGDETDFDAESGDDIMAGAGGTVTRYNGMFGFDWGIAKNEALGVNYDLLPAVLPILPSKILRDRFDLVEAASGWKNDDKLNGDERGHVNGVSTPGAVTAVFAEHILDAEGIARIDGMQAWLGGALTTLFGAGTTTFRDGNILLGGGGNDLMQGRGGYDLIDGDAWLNVRIKIVIPSGLNAGIYSAESLNTDKTVSGQFAGKVYKVVNGVPDFSQPAFGGASLTALLLNRTINPGQMSIVREILNSTNADNETDTAIFRGNYEEYDIEGRVTTGVNGTGTVVTVAADLNGDGFISVRDRDNGAVGATVIRNGAPVVLNSRGTLTDDTDLVKNIEMLRFADQTIQIHGKATLSINAALNPASADLTTVLTSFNGLAIVPTNVQWYSSTNGGITSTATATATGVSNSLLRAVVNYTDGLNQPRSLTSQWVQVGTSGSDTLNGTASADLLIGLNGDDTYAVNHINDVVLEGANGGVDVVRSTMSYTVGSNVENLVLTGSATTGIGNGLNNNITGNNSNNTLDGGSGNDVLRDSGGADLLTGGDGDDDLYGGIGADTLVGGAGNDTYYLSMVAADLFNDTITEIAGEGTDTAYSILDVTAPLAINVENLVLMGSTAVYGTGNDGDNAITGNSANNILSGGIGNDSLVGGDGNDDLYGGIDADTLVGGAGNDTYHLSKVAADGVNDAVSETLNGGIDTAYAIFDATLSANVENLILLGTAVSGTGNDSDNTITGNSSNNVLDGGLGNDSLIGGDGNDDLYGGIGADTLVGGAGDDTYHLSKVAADGVNDAVSETLNGGIDTAYAIFDATLSANVENLILLGTAISGIGNDSDNTITGNSANNILRGGLGNDSLVGGEGNDNLYAGIGNDTLVGGLGNDVYYLSAVAADGTNDTIIEDTVAGSGIDLAYAVFDATLAANVENLILLGSTAINATGNELNNTIYGNAAHNVLEGGVGNDILRDNAGNDNLVGGNGNDNLYAGIGSDTLVGGLGNDVYYLSAVAADGTNDTIIEDTVAGSGIDLAYAVFDATLAINVENLTLIGTTAINATGNDGNNTIYGNSANNVLNGGLGHDILRDNVGDDSLNGGGGNDNLYAGIGADVLAGGLGDDVYYLSYVAGDGANDTIEEREGEGIDTAYAIFSATLGANVERLTLLGSSTNTISGTGNELNNVINGNSANNALDGGAGIDYLYGNGGDDALYGGIGFTTDVLYGGAGADALDGGDGLDYASYYNFGVTGQTLTVSLDASEIHSGDAIGDTFINIEYLQGSQFANNRLTGNSGNNNLYGYNGNDTLKGSSGNDGLAGGSGNDQFVFAASGAIGASNVFTLLGTDTITDFTVGTDKIVLSQATFSSLTVGGSVTLSTIANDTAATLAAAGLTGNQFIYSTGSGRLYHNRNGAVAGFDTGAGGNAAFAILGNFATQPALSATDILVTV
jgi:Ca2+-binding RTX toxin-like protein